MKESTRFCMLLKKHQVFFLSLLSMALLTSVVISLSIKPVYESRAVFRIGSTAALGPSTPDGEARVSDEELQAYADLPRSLEKARNLAVLLNHIHSGETPFLGAPSSAFISEVYPLATFDEAILLKVRAATPQAAAGFADTLLADVLSGHEVLVEKNRKVVAELLALSEAELADMETMSESPEKIHTRILLNERIARYRQQLNEHIRDSEILQAPGDTVTKVQPRPFLYLLVGLLSSILISVVGVVMFDWLLAVRRELKGATADD